MSAIELTKAINSYHPSRGGKRFPWSTNIGKYHGKPEKITEASQSIGIGASMYLL